LHLLKVDPEKTEIIHLDLRVLATMRVDSFSSIMAGPWKLAPERVYTVITV